MLSIFPKRFPYRLVLLAAFFSLICLSSQAQKTADEDFPAELPSTEKEDTFGRTRGILGDEAIKSGANAFKFKPTYIFRRRIVRPKRVAARPEVVKPQAPPAKSGKSTPKPTPKTPKSTPKPKFDLPTDTTSKEQWETIGVTLWRLTDDSSNLSVSKETARLLVQRDGRKKEFTPVRANADTIFKRGEFVRISVETPRSGYLYIFGREVLSGDRLDKPYQVFPTMRSLNGSNFIRANQLIEIPGQSDAPFELEPKTPGYLGEMLTIVFSPTPLKDVTVLEKPDYIAAIDLVDEMEKRYLSDAGEYEQKGTNGQPYTKSEKAAGGGTRQLVQSDPYPQTKYRVKVRPNEPMLINVALNVK